jgi:hypothetical protein
MTDGGSDSQDSPEEVDRTLPGFKDATRAVADSEKFVTSLYGALFLLLFLLGVGTALDALRAAIMWLAPWVRKHYAELTKVWNVIGDILSVVILFMNDTFGFVINALHKVHVGENIKSSTTTKAFVSIANTTNDLDEIFYVLPELCGNYSSGNEIFSGIVDHMFALRSCEVLRALYPTSAHAAAEAVLLLGTPWDYAPVPHSAGQCTVPAMPWQCVPFGAGVVILEMIIPVVLLGIGISAYRRTLVETIIPLAGVPVEIVADVVLDSIKWTADSMPHDYDIAQRLADTASLQRQWDSDEESADSKGV